MHGYISLDRDGSYHMVLTIRGAFADIFWFSLFHEIGHIVNGDISKVGTYIDIDAIEENDKAKEDAADMFARNALLDATDYKIFLANGDFDRSHRAFCANSKRCTLCYNWPFTKRENSLLCNV